ncbi:MAG: chromate transporter [Eubacterium sp.]|nr:chromate transporter [Eubacterium sp.]
MDSEETKKEETVEKISSLPLRKRLVKLFLSTLYLSAFTFGGGYVIVTLLQNKFVNELHWIDEDEMLDLVAIAQSSPGAIAVNGAIVVGYKVAGIPGVLCSILGAILPPFLIITVISMFYQAFSRNVVVQALLKGMSSGVSAVILSVVWDMFVGIWKQRDAVLLIIMAGAFAANYYWNVNVALIILICAGIGFVRTLWKVRRGKQDDRKSDKKRKSLSDGQGGKS